MRILSLVAIFISCFVVSAHARRYQRPRIDLKLPTQVLTEKQTWSNVLAANTTTILNGNAGPSDATATTVSSGLGTLDYPRNITITPSGTTADVASCTVTVSGTDYNNDSMSEAFSFSANQSTVETGAKAFRTVTSVAWAASCEDSPYTATWNVGMGEVLGLSRCMSNAGDWFRAVAGSTVESTDPTITVNTSTIESNTIDFDTALDGSEDFRFFYVQSYGCD